MLFWLLTPTRSPRTTLLPLLPGLTNYAIRTKTVPDNGQGNGTLSTSRLPADETERRTFELHRRHWQRRSAKFSCSVIGDRDYLSRLTTNPDRAALTSSLLISSVFTEPSRSRPALPWGLSGQAE